MPDASAPRIIALESPGCSAVWELPPGEAPLWRYWGPRLPDGARPSASLRSERPEPSFSLHFDQPLTVFPGFGMGWFGQSALLADRGGRDWSFQAGECKVEQPDAQTVRFVLHDAVARIAVTTNYTLDPATDVMTVRTALSNEGDAPLHVHWLAAAALPLPADAAEVHSLAGRHNSEFVPVRDPLTRSVWRRENRRGLTSHDCLPGAVVTCGDGSAYGAQIAWSGNHAQTIEWIDDGRWQWQLGEWLAPGEAILAPGAVLQSPEVLATSSAEGPNGVAHAFHRGIRARMTWPGGAESAAKRPVHINTWEGFYFKHDEAALMDLARAAAGIGIERFVLDDGWFGKRDDDTSSLGDWTVDRRKYPRGLGPLAKTVTDLGMEFGLWVEPEMVNRNSDLYRRHPDWALHVDGRPLLEARNQLVLDLARPEVSAYLFDAIAALLRELPISYLKWDHNRDLVHAGNLPHYRAQVLATYALMDRLRAAFPAVEIEACAGGGGRIDAGIIKRTHRFWTSDCIDAVSRAGMQRGFLQFMPPEVMGSHVGASPAHSTGRSQSMAFRCGVALPGHFGVELDARKLGDTERAELMAGIARYKAMRERLHAGRVWMGDVGDGTVWQAHGSAEDMVVLVTRTSPTTMRHQPNLRLPMALAGRTYTIASENGVLAKMDGGWLARVGIAVPPLPGEAVLVLEVRS
ncbi:alpha-galactosidase [Novosphingobium sp.]|uniref:alpha-galactosidase n=1 Tax=Novosphingobium sp. TaxID=1874826 RepID=UPI003BAAD7C8